MGKWWHIAWLCAAVFLAGCKTVSVEHRNHFSDFVGCDHFSNFVRSRDHAGNLVLLSPEITSSIDWNQLVVSWNAQSPKDTFLKIEARVIWPDHASAFYTLGEWTPDNDAFPRTSISGQRDADGRVETDTLILNQPAKTVQVKLTLGGLTGALPEMKFLGVSFCNTEVHSSPRPPNKTAWGMILPTPERSQLAYPQQKGWCSPAAEAMVLERWAKVMHRPELNVDVPEVATRVYDTDYHGTGNWPFNTAYAGSFAGMRAYVTRFRDITDLEDWIAAGIPVVISAPWSLLAPGRGDTGNGHLVVCIGFTATGDVVVDDPATNPKKGTVRHVYRRADVIRAWAKSHNTAYLIYPDGAKLPNNRDADW